jgi:hypothetical protein
MRASKSATGAKSISVTGAKNRQRGRPRKAELEASRQDPALAGKARRTRENAVYAARAERLLDRPEHEPWVRWLFEPRKPTILAELGRIEDDLFLVEQAEWICEQQPWTHDAVALLRPDRTGREWWKRRRADEELADRLLAEINRYHRVRRLEPIDIRKALTQVRKILAVQQALEKA